MRIAHVVCVYPPYRGGMGRAAFEMVKGLNRHGHEAKALTPLYNIDTKSSQDDTVFFVQPFLSLGNGAYVPRLFSLLKQFDVIHLHYPFFGSAHIVALFRLFHPYIPLVVSAHMDPAVTGWRSVFHFMAKYTLRSLLTYATDAWIASTFDYIRSSELGSHLLTHKAQWHEIAFGVDTTRFQVAAKDASFFAHHAFSSDIPTLVFVGGMDKAHAFKGVSVLLEALSLLKKKHIPFQAFFIGRGELRQTYERTAQTLGVETEVRFLPDVTDAELPMYYQQTDVCVLPSINKGEAFGLVLLEAMACGTPVIASDLPGLRTIATFGGETVPPGDANALANAIHKRLSFPVTMEERHARHAFVASRYHWDTITQSLETLYASLVLAKKEEYTKK
jgi:glycosyltransferase involved in cell wall biosynthesis